MGEARPMQEIAEISPSMGNYLENIYTLSLDKKVVRVRDIAKKIKVRMPSVNGALKKLAELGLIRHERYEFVELTEAGGELAERILRRHEILQSFLTGVLKVSEKVAAEDACQIEHILSRETIEKLLAFLEFIQFCPKGGEEWLGQFHLFQEMSKGSPGRRLKIAGKLAGGKGRRMRLSELPAGGRAIVADVGGEKKAAEKLREKGFVKGAWLEMEESLPEKDIVRVILKGFHLSVKASEAKGVRVVMI